MKTLLTLALLCTVLLAGRSAALAIEDEAFVPEEMSGVADTPETFYLTKTLDLPFADAKTKVLDALKAQGFAVLTEIDLAATFKAKLNKDIRPYVILGACSSKDSAAAYDIDTHIGVLLPCNVVLHEQADGRVEVMIRNPHGLAQALADWAPIGDSVYAKMSAVLDSL
jgi:uncharacterized protein (DUF302 family)